MQIEDNTNIRPDSTEINSTEEPSAFKKLNKDELSKLTLAEQLQYQKSLMDFKKSK